MTFITKAHLDGLGLKSKSLRDAISDILLQLLPLLHQDEKTLDTFRLALEKMIDLRDVCAIVHEYKIVLQRIHISFTNARR